MGNLLTLPLELLSAIGGFLPLAAFKVLILAGKVFWLHPELHHLMNHIPAKTRAAGVRPTWRQPHYLTCIGATDSQLARLMRGYHKLERIALEICGLVTDKGVRALAAAVHSPTGKPAHVRRREATRTRVRLPTVIARCGYAFDERPWNHHEPSE